MSNFIPIQYSSQLESLWSHIIYSLQYLLLKCYMACWINVSKKEKFSYQSYQDNSKLLKVLKYVYWIIALLSC